MDIIEKIGDTITEKGKVAADKAKELAAIANLKSQIFLILEEKIQRPCGHSGLFTDIPQGSFHISFFQKLPFGTFQKVLPGFFILILRFLF